MYPKDAEGMANSVDTDQTHHFNPKYWQSKAANFVLCHSKNNELTSAEL